MTSREDDMPATEDLLIEVSSVARRLGVSATTVRNLERRGDLPPRSRLESTDYRVWRLSDIEEVQERRAGRRLSEGAKAL